MRDSSNSRHSSNRRQSEPENLRVLLNSREEDQREGILGISVEHDVYTDRERRRIKARRRNTLLTAILVFGVALVVIIAVVAPQQEWFKRKDYRGDGNGTTITYVVPEGASNAQIATQLEEDGVIADAGRFLEKYSDMGQGQFFQPGEYTLQKEMSSESALNSLLDLDTADKNYVAIDQTKRSTETYDALAQATGISVAEFKAFDTKPTEFGVPSKFPTLEGWLHPGEYYFDKDATAQEILQTLVDKTSAELKAEGVEGDEQIFHVLTVASILEFEGLEKDYSAIAGAIENRMNNPHGETSGYIQSDATVAYGLGKKTFQISTEQKNDASNKYNTFYYKGLPVGPIGSPANAAIRAAAHPENNNYYFWVTVNTVTGETKFAETYEEHLKNVEEYDHWCSENEGKCA